MDSDIRIYQIDSGGFDSNYSYAGISGDSAFLVDPCGDISKIHRLIKKHPGTSIKYILLTHGHHDHVTGVDEIKAFYGSGIPVAAHPLCSFPHEMNLKDHEKLAFAGSSIECIYSPGHTDDSVLYKLEEADALFTGDTLFIDCGGYSKTDNLMFRTMRKVIMPLEDKLNVYSGHNYGHCPYETLGNQKKTNPYLNADTFEKFQNNLKNL